MTSIPSNKPYRVGRSRTGLGLFATKPIKKGTKIIRYFGPLLDSKKKEEDAIENKYLFELTNRWTIDGSVRKNVARYINHACRPNAESDVKPRKRKVFIRAIKNIEPGEEINYDYGTDYFKAYLKPIGCKCAACEKKRKKQRAEARAEKARLKAKAERKALKKAEKLAKAEAELKEKLKAKAERKSKKRAQWPFAEWQVTERQASERHRRRQGCRQETGGAETTGLCARAGPSGLGLIHRVSSTGLARRLRQQQIAEVDRRALNDRTGLVDHDTKAPVCGEEGQAMPAGIGVDPALGKARDPARAHLFLQQGRRQAEAFGDDGGVDLNGAIFELDRFHALHLMLRCGGHACAGLGLAVAG